MWFQNLSDTEEAGWFPETHAHPDKFGDLWAMTPTYKLQKSSGQKDIVLLSTGGFTPLHDGHICMMEAAKIHMESQGFRVRGGYISPGHDDYVVQHKGVRIYAPERLVYANNKLKDHPWLMVDPWEAIGCSCSVNFTTVIDHLEKFLNCRVCFVVGSDNARFSLAFQEHGLLCIVPRSAEVLPNPKYRTRSYMHKSQNVFIANNEPIIGSSTDTRREMSFGNLQEKKKLILRVDADSESYLSRLLAILVDYYAEISIVRVAEQELPHGIANLVSLDQMMVSSFGNLGISRNYAEGGYIKLGYINRPGTSALGQQIKFFTNQSVSLFDDDVVTGSTMRKVSALLKEVNCKVVSYHALSFTDEGMYEILDSRDFLPISEGGLVVRGMRVPYIYPYVCPHARASILSNQAVEFSDRIYKEFWS